MVCLQRIPIWFRGSLSLGYSRMQKIHQLIKLAVLFRLRGQNLNQRPSGHEPESGHFPNASAGRVRHKPLTMLNFRLRNRPYRMAQDRGETANAR